MIKSLRANPTRIAGIIGLLLLGVATAALLGLHRARPDLDPIATPISFYHHGRGGWLLGVSLFASGLGVMAISWSLARREDKRWGLRLLAISGLGLVVAATFPANPWWPWDKALTPMGYAHATGVSLAVLLFPISAVLTTREERAASGRGVLNTILDLLVFIFVATLAVTGGITIVFIAFGRTPGFLGLIERVLVTVAFVWLVTATRIPASAAVPRAAE